ncbi:MAG: DUF6059 family protein [Actinoallomurus sp.]
MHVRRWIRRPISRCDDLLRSLVFCGYWTPYADSMPRDLPNDTDQTPQQNAVELPPGHPERLAESQPLSATERELWAALDHTSRLGSSSDG